MPAKKVLIVDDEQEVVNILMEILAYGGLDVGSAYNAEIALDILQGTRFDVIVTDHMMPGLNGAEFTRIVKALYPATVVIGMSGHLCEEAFLNAGADAFLLKPVDFDRLLSLIGNG